MDRGKDFLKSQVNNAVMQHQTFLQNLEDHERQAEDERFRALSAKYIPIMREHQRMLEEYQQQIGAELGVGKSATKTALAEIGSKMMAPKFVGGDDDQLNAFITLETLSMGVEGKVCMWKALKTVESAYPTLGNYGLDELISRGESQRERIEARRLEIAPQALAHTANV